MSWRAVVVVVVPLIRAGLAVPLTVPLARSCVTSGRIASVTSRRVTIPTVRVSVSRLSTVPVLSVTARWRVVTSLLARWRAVIGSESVSGGIERKRWSVCV